jgi:purine-binding chemotaxis protein CheW
MCQIFVVGSTTIRRRFQGGVFTDSAFCFKEQTQRLLLGRIAILEVLMSSTKQTTTVLNGIAEGGNQYLTFQLAEEQFGIDILRVQEIKGLAHLTQIPNVPPYIKGVMNLRGTVVPVVDLRHRFSMPAATYNQFTVIIIVTVGAKVMGLVVDAVSDVLNVGDSELEQLPELGGGVDTSFITGMAKSSDNLITLLDIDRLLGNTMAA